MKPLLTTFMILIFALNTSAQQSSFEALWKAVEQKEAEGLPKSALEIVTEIAFKAEREANIPQQIKALFYQSKYALTLEEDAQLKIVNAFKSTIAESEFPTKNIVQNALATLYWHYFQQNRWRFYNRTNTVTKVDTTDFRTWDLQTLFDEIHLQFKSSLTNGLLLQQEKLGAYDVIIEKQPDSRIYRPTLFDLLAHNALDFYKTDENSITKPAYKFEIDNADYFSTPRTFIGLDIQSKDSTSLQLNALKLYQDLIQFHLKDDTPEALTAVNIDRLKFVRDHAILAAKDDLYVTALQTEEQRLKNHETSGLYAFEIAKLYVDQGNAYNPESNKEVRWKLKDALAICQSTIATFPKSKAAKQCEILKQQIVLPILKLKAESFIPVSTHSRIGITYKNIDELQFKIYAMSASQQEQLSKRYRAEDQLAFITKLKLVTQWQATLRDEGDFQMHTTEIVLPGLDQGHYVIFATPQADDAAAFGFTSIQVTDLALVDKSTDTHSIFQVVHRMSGKPIVNAKVDVQSRRYNDKISTTSYVTNALGEIHLKKLKDRYRDVSLYVSHGDDQAMFEGYYVSGYYGNGKDNFDTYSSFLFTDRSIYRPGQTVYFKGIVIETMQEKSHVVKNESVSVILVNVNGEEVSKTELKTNDFGSVSGEFILPESGLNGQYHIALRGKHKSFRGQSSTYFSVEEYKRPKFETSFKPITDIFRVNDSITIKGQALAYAGSTVSNANVVYRVHRKVQFPRWYYWYHPWFQSEPQEITFGTTETTDDGSFEITFKALPDSSVDKDHLPIFHYEVTADVTDLNGETRSAVTTVNVGYHALKATVTIESSLDKSQKDNKITIDTKNLNGEFVPAQGILKVYKLKAPEHVLRQRPWKAPDYHMLSESDFKKLFPNDAYRFEDNPLHWEKGAQVFETDFDTSNSTEIALKSISDWQSGHYMVLLETKDTFGQLVKDESLTYLYGANDKRVPDNQLFTITADQDSYKPGDEVRIKLGSAGNIYVTVDVEKDRQIVRTVVVKLHNSYQTIVIPVTSDDLGGFIVHYSFAAYNGYQSGQEQINVPYPKTDLEIETMTFRDKLQPGQEESWQFKIKGPKGEHVATELLASMYDVSLDQFRSHQWQFNPLYKPTYHSRYQRHAGRAFDISNFRMHLPYNMTTSFLDQRYDQLNWFGFHFGYGRFANGLVRSNMPMAVEESESLDEVVVTAQGIKREKKALGYAVSDVSAGDLEGLTENEVANTLNDTSETTSAFDGIQIRKNLQETAFFFPHLQTDSEGNIAFSFSTPESLTRWKLQLLAHTETLESAVTSMETVTQKELMVLPNVPRFLRQGDHISISTKVSNLTDKSLSGQASLQLYDALTGKSVNADLSNQDSIKNFNVDAKGNTQVSWKLMIPNDYQAIQYKIIAKAGDFSDGEQNALAVLTNRTLVTETMPMWIKSNETRTFTLDKLKTTSSASLKHHKLTLEMTSNPAWYAVQALPYLMEYPYECNEQTFARFYANVLASHIANSNPRIKEVFDQWRTQEALISNLEKNEELKSILIQETPWIRDAQSETEQKKRIALLFDINKMANELQMSLRKLRNSQMASGAWSWFNGGYENRYITQHIISGFGHLKHLDVISNTQQSDIDQMIKKAINYLDSEFVKEYKDIRKYDKNVDMNLDHLSHTQLHYLYMRSYFPDIKSSKEVQEITAYYQTQIKKYWLSRPLYAKGMMALIAHRMNDTSVADSILKSLKETSITSDELGMYWKENTNSWHWYQAPIETQALMIEAFSEITSDSETIDNLKIWLLKHKQTNQWKTTKATTEAVYALLLEGSDWLSVTEMVDVTIGGEKLTPSKLEDVRVEAGTGYYKTSWNASDIEPEMAEVTLTKKGEGIAWGSLYWQYFEDLDKISSAETPLKLKKKLFLKSHTANGEQLAEVTTDTPLKVGDLIRVRIELRSDRPMTFVHMKDMRASGLEPVNVLSQYKWQDGLGYYESTKDASTNFFFDYLPKGVFVFEYDLRVNNAGNMSNGITTIQSMYAPEFSSHSEGSRIDVKN